MSGMTCRELVELVSTFLDEAFDSSTARRFADHLGRCPGCKSYLDQFKRTISSLGQSPTTVLSTTVRDSLLRAFRGESV